MSFLQDNKGDLRELLRDAEDSDNPQKSEVPDSVRDSALQELRRRGYHEPELTRIRLGTYIPTAEYRPSI